MNPTLTHVTEIAGWTLVHSIWQLAAIAAVAALVLRMLRASTANARYATACLALATMAIAPLLTAGLMAGSMDPPQYAPAAEHGIAPPATSGAQPSSPTPLVNGFQEHPKSASDISTASPSGWIFGMNPRPLLAKVFPYIVAAWLAGVLLLSARLTAGCAAVRRLRATGADDATPRTLRDTAAALARQLGISRPVHIMVCSAGEVPMAFGVLKPIVLIPAAALAGLTPAQVELIIAHELAHIRRHDYLVNLMQHALETWLFYHPAVWWVSSQARVEREHCCDDMAAAVCGNGRKQLASALVRLEELRAGDPGLALAASGGNLRSRVARLLRPEANPAAPMGPPRNAAWAAGIIAIGALTLMLLTIHATAQDTITSEPAVATAPPDQGGRDAAEQPGNSPVIIVIGDAVRPDTAAGILQALQDEGFTKCFLSDSDDAGKQFVNLGPLYRTEWQRALEELANAGFTGMRVLPARPMISDNELILKVKGTAPTIAVPVKSGQTIQHRGLNLRFDGITTAPRDNGTTAAILITVSKPHKGQLTHRLAAGERAAEWPIVFEGEIRGSSGQVLKPGDSLPEISNTIIKVWDADLLAFANAGSGSNQKTGLAERLSERITKDLRLGEEISLRQLRVRLLSVEPIDPADPANDTVNLFVRQPLTTGNEGWPSRRGLERSKRFGDYDVHVIEIKRDTDPAAAIVKVEAVYIQSDKLQVATFNLTPRQPLSENLEKSRELAQSVVTVVKTILYSQSTESAAAAEGRRYWYDPNTLQLTVTDYPENLTIVSDYVRSLPIFDEKQKSEIVILKHQASSDM